MIDFVKRLTNKPGCRRRPLHLAGYDGVAESNAAFWISSAAPDRRSPTRFCRARSRKGGEHEIRECIGCNICISSWHDGVPVRCTQNPTAGEEWRRGWHPERFDAAGKRRVGLVVGGGPAGLECAVTLGRRGHEVTLAEAAGAFGGRLSFETRLPGLSTWGRVRRLSAGPAGERPNVKLYPGSQLGVDEILELEHRTRGDRHGGAMDQDAVFRHGVSRGTSRWPSGLHARRSRRRRRAAGPVVVFDFDNYYMGGALPSILASWWAMVSYVTPAGNASAWTIMTNELPLVQRALVKAGVPIHTLQRVTAFDGEAVTLADVYSGTEKRLACRSLVIVGVRKPSDELYHALAGPRIGT